MEHTQGKWFNNGGRIYAQQGDNIREICDIGLVNHQSKEDTANHQSKEDTANARLITASQELLMACKQALKDTIAGELVSQAMLEDAIAKATN